MKNLPNELRSMRMVAGYTKEEVAARIGLKDPNTIRRWEMGESTPSTPMLFKLCALYHVLVSAVYPKLNKKIAGEMNTKMKKQAATSKPSKGR